MEKVYRLLQWLDTKQAVDWLQDMTATRITVRELLQLCAAKQCDMYICAPGLEGIWFDPDGNEQKCSGVGYQKVIGRFIDPPIQRLQLEGEFWEHPIDEACYPNQGYWEANAELEAGYGIYFKPSDVEALAMKMNGTAEYAADLEALRSQLEQETAARKAAEAELLKFRAEGGKQALDKLRNMTMYSPAEFAAMRERAEQAEHMVTAMEKQLTEQAEQKRLDEKIFSSMASQLRELHSDAQPSSKGINFTGLSFPYSTKHLEAMRDAAVEFWQHHDPTKPAPYGIQKTVQGFLAKQTGENARKLAELAKAIKPDGLPKS